MKVITPITKRNILLISFALLFLTNCKTVKFDAINETKVVNNILNKWHKDVAEYNFDEYFDAISADGYYIGTDEIENWKKSEFKQFSKPLFDKKHTWNFKTKHRNIFFSNNNKIAWFNELLDTWMGTCRGSGVLEMSNGKWKIKQYVLSVTVPNSEMNKVVKIKKLKE